MVHEVEHRFHFFGADSFEVEQEVLVILGPSQDVSEERTAGTEDDFVGCKMIIFTGKGQVKQFTVMSQFFE